MSYAKQDGKDKVLFVDKDYVEQQPEIEVPKSNEQESKGEDNDQAAAFDPETGEINWDCPCKCFGSLEKRMQRAYGYEKV